LEHPPSLLQVSTANGLPVVTKREGSHIFQSNCYLVFACSCYTAGLQLAP
jgi:hypothetical protein